MHQYESINYNIKRAELQTYAYQHTVVDNKVAGGPVAAEFQGKADSRSSDCSSLREQSRNHKSYPRVNFIYISH